MSELGDHVMSLAPQRSVSSLATLIISIIVFKEVPKIQSDDEERRKVQTNLIPTDTDRQRFALKLPSEIITKTRPGVQ